MQTTKYYFTKLAAGLTAALRLVAYSSSADTYTDLLGDHQGSANLLRDLSSAVVSNDAGNLYIKLNMNPGANIASGGNFNYVIGITTGPGAGGDTSANATTHGNPYTRSISFDSSLGGMTDFIGVFGAGGAGSVASPFTSYGFNTYAWNTNGVSLTWSKTFQVNSGMPISSQPSTIIPNSIDLTIPMNSFAANLSLTPGTTILSTFAAPETAAIRPPMIHSWFKGRFRGLLTPRPNTTRPPFIVTQSWPCQNQRVWLC